MKMYTKKMADLRDRAKKVAGALRSKAQRADELDELHPALLEALWESGFMTMSVPRDNGGHGLSTVEASVVVEELARGSGAAALMVLLQSMACSVISDYASDKHKDELLAKVVDERGIMAFALSEPGPEEGGSVTRAKKIKSGYSVQGRKTFVSGAREADIILVFAVTSPKSGLKKALSCFAVPAGTTGMIPGKELSKSGLRGVPAVDIVFEGCKVPASYRLGKQGEGYSIAGKALVAACPLAASLSMGLLAEALDQSLSSAKTRGEESFSLSESQPLEMALAEMAGALDSGRAFVWAAARAVDEGMEEAERMGREVKCMATESAVTEIDKAMRMFGLSGTLRGSALERLSRDARAAQIVLGPNHIHRIEVARKLLACK